MAVTDASHTQVEDIYHSIVKPDFSPDMGASLNELISFNRSLNFLSGEGKHWFLQKYGSVRTNVSSDDGGWSLISGSNVLQGFFSSIDSDARLAAVVGELGTRPFLTADLAISALIEKRIQREGGTNLTAGAEALFGRSRGSLS